MYFIKDGIVINKDISQVEMAKEIGCSQETLSRILNKKQSCSKTLAYAITKLINPDFEISTLFEIK
jgi:DNA-binding XRE family transcriptional regulator